MGIHTTYRYVSLRIYYELVHFIIRLEAESQAAYVTKQGLLQ